MKTLFLSFIALIAVIVHPTPTIWNVSMLSLLCATIIMIGYWPCIDGKTIWSHSKLVLHWISMLIRKFVHCSQPNVSFLMLNPTGDGCFLHLLCWRTSQTILPEMSWHLFGSMCEWILISRLVVVLLLNPVTTFPGVALLTAAKSNFWILEPLVVCVLEFAITPMVFHHDSYFLFFFIASLATIFSLHDVDIFYCRPRSLAHFNACSQSLRYKLYLTYTPHQQNLGELGSMWQGCAVP